MIKHWHITGDTHGGFSRFDNLKFENPEEHAIIILGDFGINYFLNKTDQVKKTRLNEKGFYIYAIRGNHEARPKSLENIKEMYDPGVQGIVYYEEEFPHIRYMKEFGFYVIEDKVVFVIGGAYSVDKYYRLINKYQWFEDEQLSEHERRVAESLVKNNKVDIVLSHTCPYSWRPTDLFLSCIDQTTVDNTMEIWMNELKEKFEWKYWLFGHFHDDRIVRDQYNKKVYMLYSVMIDFESIGNDLLKDTLTHDPKINYPC